MNIGILTFHWGTNYGAVLQAYALQKFLQYKGHKVEIINYAPLSYRDKFLKCFNSKNPIVVLDNIKNYFKEKNIKNFRNNYLQQTARYFTTEQLIANLPLMDAYISGSDQVWNPYALKTNKYLYFLPFTKGDSKKIAFAASFGVTDYPPALIEQIKPLLKKFDGISVRETSGLEILNLAGIREGIVISDPTLLLDKNEYTNIFERKVQNKKFDYFFYVLQKKQKIIKQIYNQIKQKKGIKIAHTNRLPFATMGVENWLSHLYNSKFVVTNSFHGVIFSIIFHKSFVVVPIEGNLSGMNDRIITLLNKFDLMDRIVIKADQKEIEELLNKKIDWNYVDEIKNKCIIETNYFLGRYLK